MRERLPASMPMSSKPAAETAHRPVAVIPPPDTDVAVVVGAAVGMGVICAVNPSVNADSIESVELFASCFRMEE
jgi:hypothetical protein